MIAAEVVVSPFVSLAEGLTPVVLTLALVSVAIGFLGTIERKS